MVATLNSLERVICLKTSYFALVFHATVGQHGLINTEIINKIQAYNPNTDESGELNLVLTES